MEIIDRIKFDGPSNGGQWLIHKCPSEQFVLGSQLIVNQGQEALFFKGGEALDLFSPGTHTLSTGNLPLLHKLVNLPFGGKTPFTAEIYYINKTDNLDMKWGTSTPIPLEDPKYGLILNIGARGQYGVRISDGRLFVAKLVGAVPSGATSNHTMILKYFNGLINSKIKSVTAGYMIQKKISFLEISLYLSKLSDTFQAVLSDEFERFGIELVNFYCEAIVPRSGEYEKLRGYKEELALGPDFYQQRRSLDILEKMAENSSAGSVADAGRGLGMGRGMMRQKGDAYTGTGQSVDSAAPAATLACPHCGANAVASMKFCGNCGKPLGSIKCPACGCENEAGMKFCGNCGQKL